MEKKIFIIEYQNKGEYYKEYALSLESAENYLTERGYQKTQEYNESENDAGLFIRPKTDFFAEQKARIISRNLI